MTTAITQKMINYFGTDVRRINHALKVHAFARHIAMSEGLNEDALFIVETVALLHDIGIKVAEEKYNSCSGHYQEIEGPGVARELLHDMQITTQTLERIVHIIGHHHSYQKVDGIDFRIIVEADFLVNVFEDAITAHAINAFHDKHFETKTGKQLLAKMYNYSAPQPPKGGVME
jgi:uncharacterized protein